jgi:hypothetical protein
MAAICSGDRDYIPNYFCGGKKSAENGTPESLTPLLLSNKKRARTAGTSSDQLSKKV